MNAKQRSSNDEPNRDPNSPNENQLAEQTARVLELRSLEGQTQKAQSQDDQATAELGQLLREAAKSNLPESNLDLQDLLLAELDVGASATESDQVVLGEKLSSSEVASGSTARRFLIAAAASGLLLVSGTIAYNSGFVGAFSNVAMLENAKEPVAKAVGHEKSKPGSPDFVMHERHQGNQKFDEDRERLSTGDSNPAASTSDLDDNGLARRLFDQTRPAEDTGNNGSMTFPNADEWKGNGLRRSHFQDFRLSKDSEGRSVSGPLALEVGDGEAQQFRGGQSFVSGVADKARVEIVNVEEIFKNNSTFAGGVKGLGGELEQLTADVSHFKQVWQNGRYRTVEKVERRSRSMLLNDKVTGGEQYEPIFENAFTAAKGSAAISTFSIDVDTASYANMRRMLNSGRRPPPNSIRLEELVNYFQYDYPQPTDDHPFSVNLELAECPWQDGQQLLRVGLKGKEIHVAERPATNVVFLIDVSGSMSSNDKLPLLKSGFQMMARQLGENDRVSIVTYAGNAGVVLPPTNGTQTSTINSALEKLSSGGSTHGSAGIQLAYELAQKNFIQGGVNRVMLATDGDLNVGVTSDDALVRLIKEKAAEGVFLTVLGFGTGNLKDGKLEKLADNGNGVYSYIDSTREAHRVLVDQLSGSLVTIAKDVKIQVEFNPAEVKSYRLLGYENRMLKTKDFDDDTKDAGEIGAGHTVTAIYQIEPAKAVAPTVSLPAGMKYQIASAAKPKTDDGRTAADDDKTKKDGLSKAALSGELATVALRYKQPDASESERLEVSIKNQPKRFDEASTDFRFAADVAAFGMFLRNSEHKGSINARQLLRIASESVGKDKTGHRSEFIDLIRKAAAISKSDSDHGLQIFD